jgi:hypothetical protein
MNADRLTGVAEKIRVQVEVRGLIEAIGADSFTILGQMIDVNAGTRFVRVADLAGLRMGDRVEVHGLRDADGRIMATRVVVLGPEDEAEDEVRGVVSNMTGSTFDIGGLTITFNDDTVIEPAGAAFGNGDLVEVHLNGTVAVRIEVERLDAEFELDEGLEFEIEGFISGFTDASSEFMVNGQPVRLAGGVEFRGGDETDLGDNVKVEAEGQMSGGVLLADKITFKDTIRIEANADADGSANVLGKTVAVRSSTRLKNLPNGLADILAGDGVKVRGFLGMDGSTIMATRVQKHSHPMDADKILLRGPVSSFDASPDNLMLVIAGITVTISGVEGGEIEKNDNTISLEEFFGSLTLDRSIVKARGTFSEGILAANQIEIEME